MSRTFVCLVLFPLPMERPQGAGDTALPPHVAPWCPGLNRGAQWPTRRGVFRWKCDETMQSSVSQSVLKGDERAAGRREPVSAGSFHSERFVGKDRCREY